MGPPGSGKGTHAQRLIDTFGLVHLSSGDILRAERAGGSDLGKRLGEYMQAGRLVPDEIVVEIMAKAVASVDGRKGLVLDGFPRTVAQAKALDEQLEKAGKPLDGVIVLEARDDLIVERITGRRIHPASGRIYHVKTMPPKVAGMDDPTGEPLIQRDDDREEVVLRRLATYRSQTQPVVEYYRSRQDVPVLDFDGGGPLEEVAGQLARAVRNWNVRV